MIFADLALQTPDGAAPGGFRGQRQKHLSRVEKNLLVRYLREAGDGTSPPPPDGPASPGERFTASWNDVN